MTVLSAHLCLDATLQSSWNSLIATSWGICIGECREINPIREGKSSCAGSVVVHQRYSKIPCMVNHQEHPPNNAVMEVH